MPGVKEQFGNRERCRVARPHALATTQSLLVSLSHTKFEVAMKIVNTVFKRLKNIDYEEKATRAIHTMNRYFV